METITGKVVEMVENMSEDSGKSIIVKGLTEGVLDSVFVVGAAYFAAEAGKSIVGFIQKKIGA